MSRSCRAEPNGENQTKVKSKVTRRDKMRHGSRQKSRTDLKNYNEINTVINKWPDPNGGFSTDTLSGLYRQRRQGLADTGLGGAQAGAPLPTGRASPLPGTRTLGDRRRGHRRNGAQHLRLAAADRTEAGAQRTWLSARRCTEGVEGTIHHDYGMKCNVTASSQTIA
jgi:hypothetical protein